MRCPEQTPAPGARRGQGGPRHYEPEAVAHRRQRRPGRPASTTARRIQVVCCSPRAQPATALTSTEIGEPRGSSSGVAQRDATDRSLQESIELLRTRLWGAKAAAASASRGKGGGSGGPRSGPRIGTCTHPTCTAAAEAEAAAGAWAGGGRGEAAGSAALSPPQSSAVLSAGSAVSGGSARVRDAAGLKTALARALGGWGRVHGRATPGDAAASGSGPSSMPAVPQVPAPVPTQARPLPPLWRPGVAPAKWTRCRELLTLRERSEGRRRGAGTALATPSGAEGGCRARQGGARVSAWAGRWN